MTKEETINLIAGRIIDEYRKHPDLNWSLISAQKIYSQWNEYYSQQTKALTDEIEELKQDLFNIKMESSHEIADLVKTNQETQKELDETFHKLEGYIEHNKQLQSRISELEKCNEWISVEDRLPLATESGNWDGKRSDIYLGKYKDGTYCLFRIYTGFMDGSYFTEYYDENDNSIYPPTYYKPIH